MRQTQRLDYFAPTPGPSAKFGIVAIYTAFLTALLFLIVSHGSVDAPLRNPSNTYTPFADIERQLKIADADPRPAQIHFDIADRAALPLQTTLMYTRVYYSAQYLRYPHRLFVGQDDVIINNEKQLLANDALPPLAWMRQHQVGSIYTVHDQGPIGPGLSVTAVP